MTIAAPRVASPIRVRAARRLRAAAGAVGTALATAYVVSVPREDGTEDVWPLQLPYC